MAASPGGIAAESTWSLSSADCAAGTAADPEGWENSDLERFLEALAAWIEDSGSLSGA